MLRQSLQTMVDKVEGGVAGLLMGFDGIAVESYAKEVHEVDIQAVGIEFCYIVTQVRRAAQVLEVGSVREVTIKAELVTIVMQVLNEEYFLALALKPDGNFGKGRYLLRMMAPKMMAQF